MLGEYYDDEARLRALSSTYTANIIVDMLRNLSRNKILLGDISYSQHVECVNEKKGMKKMGRVDKFKLPFLGS